VVDVPEDAHQGAGQHHVAGRAAPAEDCRRHAIVETDRHDLDDAIPIGIGPGRLEIEDDAAPAGDGKVAQEREVVLGREFAVRWDCRRVFGQEEFVEAGPKPPAVAPDEQENTVVAEDAADVRFPYLLASASEASLALGDRHRRVG